MVLVFVNVILSSKRWIQVKGTHPLIPLKHYSAHVWGCNGLGHCQCHFEVQEANLSSGRYSWMKSTFQIMGDLKSKSRNNPSWVIQFAGGCLSNCMSYKLAIGLHRDSTGSCMQMYMVVPKSCMLQGYNRPAHHRSKKLGPNNRYHRWYYYCKDRVGRTAGR